MSEFGFWGGSSYRNNGLHDNFWSGFQAPVESEPLPSDKKLHDAVTALLPEIKRELLAVRVNGQLVFKSLTLAPLVELGQLPKFIVEINGSSADAAQSAGGNQLPSDIEDEARNIIRPHTRPLSRHFLTTITRS